MFFPRKGDEIESDRSSRAMRKRSTLRLLMELYFCGVFEEGNLFVNIVKDLTNTDHLRDQETTQTNLSLLVSFARTWVSGPRYLALRTWVSGPRYLALRTWVSGPRYLALRT
jgi:hypothetical protein